MKLRNYLLFLWLIGMSGMLSAQILDKSWGRIVNEKEGDWFGSDEAESIAENVLLYQRDIGGWPKNIQMHKPLSEEEKQALIKAKSDTKNVTMDNGATTREMLFLSKVYRQAPDERYKEAFLKGLDYLLAAQYENGGWPQFYPLREGYYSYITYNDNAMVNIMGLLKNLIDQSGYYSIEPPEGTMENIKLAFDKGVDCILKTQYKQNGLLTGWCAQHDPETLEPAKARSYELPSLSGQESAGIVLLLMSIENPSSEVRNSIYNAVDWFDKSKILGLRQDRTFRNRKLVRKTMVEDPDAEPLWGRFMQLEDNKPFFCDRDGIKKYALSEIGKERRIGYRWYAEAPRRVLSEYSDWTTKYGADFIISTDGSEDFTRVQDAIDAIPHLRKKRTYILIKQGVYKEKLILPSTKTNVTFIGEGADKTVLTFDDFAKRENRFGEEIGTSGSSSFYIYGDGFEARNITFENSYGEGSQAVAVRVDGDKVKFINCRFLGNQDTLYPHGKDSRQYYRNCYIEGTVDFIFGWSTAWFEDCEIYCKRNGYITAASTEQSTKYGFVFNNCKVDGSAKEGSVFLGRPWRPYAKTVFMNCDLGEIIHPDGWDPWRSEEKKKTAFYAEFNNTGPGYQPEKRAEWTTILSPEEARKFTTELVLGNWDISK